MRIRTQQTPQALDRQAIEVVASVDGALVDPAGHLVGIFDRDGRIRHFNRACERATGFTRAEVLGRDAREVLIPPEEAAQLESCLARVGRTDAPFPREAH